MTELALFRDGLIGMPVSHVWRGYGCALFLEFGRLSPRTRRDGNEGNPDGEFGVMIQSSWRIESARTILCGSWSDEALWEPAFVGLIGRTVVDVNTFGRLPELTIALTEDLHVSSFMTAEGEPAWALFDCREGTVTLSFKNGELCVSHDTSTASSGRPSSA
jgi:hypothetical protein